MIYDLGMKINKTEKRKKGLNYNNHHGVTLIELLVSLTLFSVVMLAATAIFQLVVEGQRSAIAAQNTQDNMRYFFETISKEVRSAKKDLSGACTGVAGRVYATNVSEDILYFKNYRDYCTTYYLANNIMMISRDDLSSPPIIASTTPNEIKVSNLKFKIIDDGVKQPAVTLKLEVEAIGKKLNQQPLKMQTTISSRLYN